MTVAFGQRLISAGGRFQSMGIYEQGELQKISETMISAGQALCASSSFIAPEQLPETEIRILKFGELQVAVTPENATVGTTIAVLFGVPESSLQYANDNALQLAKSLRGALLGMFYASTVLCALSSAGLVLLAQDLKSTERNSWPSQDAVSGIPPNNKHVWLFHHLCDDEITNNDDRYLKTTVARSKQLTLAPLLGPIGGGFAAAAAGAASLATAAALSSALTTNLLAPPPTPLVTLVFGAKEEEKPKLLVELELVLVAKLALARKLVASDAIRDSFQLMPLWLA
ncbi:hypothetical protein AKJ16_DCAP09465 [Drosera capensis]